LEQDSSQSTGSPALTQKYTYMHSLHNQVHKQVGTQVPQAHTKHVLGYVGQCVCCVTNEQLSPHKLSVEGLATTGH